MIYTGSSGVVLSLHAKVYQPTCYDCGKVMADHSTWSDKGRDTRWRCINKECVQCAVPKEPFRVPSFTPGRWMV